MSITDELMEWTRNHTVDCSDNRIALVTIAKRIDAEHEHEMEKRADRYSELRAKMNNCYIELPKDVDGEYIRIGDVLTDDAEFKSEGIVVRLMLGDEGWIVGFGDGGWTKPSIHEWHHHHAPTVEDVLRQFLGESDSAISLGYDEVPHDVFAKYAAKLRLAGDAS